MNVVFWQPFPSLLLGQLFSELAKRGFGVTLASTGELTARRRRMGWHVPDLPGVRIERLSTTASALRFAHENRDSVHVFSGTKGPTRHVAALLYLASHKARIGLFSEPYRNQGLKGLLRRLEWNARLRPFTHRFSFALATGEKATQQFVDGGISPERVFEFGYFPESSERPVGASKQQSTTFLFVGALEPRKGVADLIEAARAAGDPVLRIVGDGPERRCLERLASRLQLRNVSFIGTVPRKQLDSHLDQADVLVLPSHFDGWGAVVNEALCRGLRVLVSDACGSSLLPPLLEAGATFPAGDKVRLAELMRSELRRGPVSPEERAERRKRSECISPERVAGYLAAIFNYIDGQGARPEPPWRLGTESMT